MDQKGKGTCKLQASRIPEKETGNIPFLTEMQFNVSAPLHVYWMDFMRVYFSLPDPTTYGGVEDKIGVEKGNL